MQDNSIHSDADLLAEELELFRYLLEQEGVIVSHQQQIPRRTPSAVIPLSLAQERMWFLDQMQPGNPAANISFVVRLSGPLDIEAFWRSLHVVVQRHESLRTTFVIEGNQPQQLIAPALTLPLDLVDLRALAGTDQEGAVQRLIREHARHRFDLVRGPLLHTRLLQRANDEFLLLVTMHHIVSDAWSIGVMLRECATCYAAMVASEPLPLPELPIQYPDFAVWQRDWLERPDDSGVSPLQRQMAYWKRQLAGAPAALELPTDRPRPPAQTFVGAKHRFTVPPALLASLQELSQREGASLFMTLLATFQVLLARWSGQDDIVVGSPIANRTRPEIEGLIGFFVNTLVLRGDLSGNPSFRELLARVRETTLGAYDHQDLPFERLVEELKPPRDLSRTPLFQVLFILQNAPLPAIELGQLSLRNQPFETATVQFDLEFSLAEVNNGLNAQIDYNIDLFDAATIVRMAGHYQALLHAIVANPDQPIRLLPLLTEAEQRRFAAWNRPPWPLPPAQCLHTLVGRQARQTPDATALVVGTERLSYHELDRRANRLAHLLRSHGAGPEQCVGVCMTRTAELVVAILAVLKAGAAYVPLDPAYPADRIAFMLADSGAGILLTTTATQVELPFQGTIIDLVAGADAIAAQPDTAPATAVTPDNLAYLIYTSGSTGRPKGVAIVHRTAAARLAWAHATYNPQQLAGVLASTSVCFDLSIFELFAPLSSGGTVLLAANALALPTLPAASEVTLVNTVPSAMAALLSSGGLPASVTTVNLAGEPLPLSLARQIYAQTAVTRVYNLYGPSEDTTYSTGTLIPPDATSITIGRPLPHTQVYLLDRALQPVPVGAIGEVYLGGAGLARGYYGRPELTAERFIPVGPEARGLRLGEEDTAQASSLKPLASRLYRTGDLARFRPDGTLEYLGRIDHQVKLRGFRIELGEIEAALRRHPDVRDAVVVAREDTPGDKRIVAYVVLAEEPRTKNQEPNSEAGGLRLEAGELKTHLRQSLPDYMVPSAFVLLPALPLTPNGKVDRKALPAADGNRTDQERAYTAPRTPAETKLAALWSEVLHLPQVGIHDNFFELGGHSLLATQLVSRVREAFGVGLSLSELFAAPTVAQQAELIEIRDVEEWQPTSQRAPLVAAEHGNIQPLSFSQERLWFLNQLQPDSSLYNIASLVQLQGQLDVGALRRSFEAIIQRHEVLRTTFTTVDGQPVQVIASAAPLALELLDFRRLPPEQRQAAVLQAAETEVGRPFDLVRGPLSRAALLQHGDQEFLLIVTMHHIISDGWSLGVMVREFADLYASFAAGQPAALPPLPIQYADFAGWQRGWLSQPDHSGTSPLQRQLAYWKQQLAGAPAALELPADHPRPLVQTYAGAAHRFTIPPALTAGLQELSQREGASLFMTLLAAFQTLLFRYSGQDDIVVGSPIANRTRPEIEPLIGCFINTLVLRTDLSGNPTFHQLLERVRETTLGAYDHQDLPFERLVEELKPPRDLGRSPLFQVMLVLQNAPMPPLDLAGLTLQNQPVDVTTARFDLELTLLEAGGELQALLAYNTDLYQAGTIARMAGHFQMLLSSIVADPGQPIQHLALLPPIEQDQLLAGWNATGRALPAALCLHELLAQQVERNPDAVALVVGEEQLSYRTLDTRANRLAHLLRAQGIGPDQCVGICMTRSADLLIAVLAVLKAGGTYVPLEPAYPPDRIAIMLADSRAGVVLTTGDTQVELPFHGTLLDLSNPATATALASQPDTAPHSVVVPDNLAYVLFTSGSTGRPKGVQISHRALVNFLCSMQREPGLTGQDTLLAVTTLAFDISCLELFLPLLTGARIVLVDRAVATDGALLAEAIERSGATVMQATPATWRMLLEAGWTGNPRLTVLSGGEALPRDLAERLRAGCARVWNMYGPTETTVWSTLTAVADGTAALVPIGRPIDNTQIYILDPHMQPTPVNVPGELFIGGTGLARGYIGRPDLTAERFVPNPFGERLESRDVRLVNSEPLQASSLKPQASRLYRTGDLARWLPDGQIEFLGRADHQVKLRGFRIELGEIESVLRRHPAVHNAVVVVREDQPGDKRIVAYFVPVEEPRTKNQEPDIETEEFKTQDSKLKTHLRQSLPEYMVPSAFVMLPRLPLTPNGKVDRKALPAPERSRPELERPYAAPRNPVEAALAALWSAILGAPQVGIHDNFFELGGHSLLATQLVSRIRETLRVELPLRQLFSAPTVAQQAALVEAAQAQSRRPMPAMAVERNGPQPLSFSQERLWFLDQLEPGSPLYSIASPVRILGQLDVEVLRRSLETMSRRHEVLRTTFVLVDQQPVQVILPELPLPLEVEDVSALPPSECDAAVKQATTVEARQPFDLVHGPLVRARLIRIDPTDWLLLITMHHIISDGWSITVMMRELTQLYSAFARGEQPALPPLPVQYADYAAWQRTWLAQPDASGTSPLQHQMAYWTRRLAGAPAALDLPTDRPRPPVQTFNGASHRFVVPPALTASLYQLSQRESASLFMALLAAFQTLLFRYSGQDDIVVGTPIAGRTRPEIEPLIGCFINTLVLRTQLSGDPSFRQLLARVRETTLGAYDHQDLPFERLVEELKPPRDLSRSPLFQVMLVLQNAPMRAVDVAGITLRPETVETTTAKFDLELSLIEFGGALNAQLDYNTDLFDASTIARMAGHFLTLLASIVASPDMPVSRLALLDAAEQTALLAQQGMSAPFSGHACIHQLFEQQAARTPDAPALEWNGQRLSYRELNQRANQLAHHLRGMGIRPEQRVGICMGRTGELIVGLLAVLKAGAAYVPLDPAYPPERLLFMVADAQVRVLLTDSDTPMPWFSGTRVDLVADWPLVARQPAANPATEIDPEQLAYVIYTSGSTGQPKGVLIEHRSLVNYAEAARDFYAVAPADRVLQFSSISFDASAEEIYIPLISGAALVLRSDAMIETVETFLRTCAAWQISVIMLPTAFWHELVVRLAANALALPATVRLMVIGGERVLPERVALWQQHAGAQVRLVNTYGPTEATIAATMHEVPAAPGDQPVEVPIGRPVRNLAAYVLDRHLALVPFGVPGELYLGGAGLARGYLDRPALTAERFVPSPFGERLEARGLRLVDAEAPQVSSLSPQTSRLYRTGDLVRMLPDGTLEFLGRVDQQVKLRGFRIELGEIEAALRQHPAVREAVVLAREDQGGDKRLVAYVVPAEEPNSEAGDLRLEASTLKTHLRERLPDYMVPAVFVTLPALPLTPGGKLDRKALPAPDSSQPELEQHYVAPRTPIEMVLVALWAGILNIPRLGIYDNFFDLGGHSLLATQLVSRIRETLQVELPLRELFAAPTVAQQAALIETRRVQAGLRVADTAPLVPVERDGPLPLSFAQQRLWFLDQLQPNSPLYNIPAFVRLHGRLDVDALRRSFETIIQRHEVLRTTFAMVDGQPVQVITPNAALALELLDFRLLPAEERDGALQRAANEEAQRPFDLARGPLVRAALLQRDDEEFLLLVTTHHSISDGWSVGVMTHEFAALYAAFAAGRPPELPALPVQYADFALWQRNWLERPDSSGESPLQRQLAYWKRQLAGLPAALELPTDRPRPPVQTFHGASHPFVIPATLTTALHQLGQREGASLFMTLLAAFQVLLARWSGQDDIAVGTPIAGRTRPETEPLIGFFVNTLVLRGDLSGNPSFRELLGHVREITLDAYDHQDLPFERLVEELQPPRDLSRSPLFQVMLMLQNVPMPAIELTGLTLQSLPISTATVKFDLELNMVEAGGLLSAQIDYNTDLFDAATIARMAGHFLTLLAGAVANPATPISRLPLLTEAERRTFAEWNRPPWPLPPARCLHELVAQQAARTPDATALVAIEQRLSYRELDTRANRLAHLLRAQGAGPEQCVGICLPRTPELVIAILAVLKAGAAYVPLDPAYPAERIAFMLADSQASLLIASAETRAELPFSGTLIDPQAEAATIASQPDTAPATAVTPDNLAYLIYTSGSTGRPKGVAIAHHTAAARLAWAYATYTPPQLAGVLASTSVCFDLSIFELFAPLSCGGTVVLAVNALALPTMPAANEVTLVNTVPSAMAALLSNGGSLPPSVEVVNLAGEPLPLPLVQQVYAQTNATAVYNLYGPSEDTTYSTAALIPPDATSVTIGQPLPHTQAFLLDRHGQPVPVGVIGEVYLGGAGLTRGYFARPELTAERFIPVGLEARGLRFEEDTAQASSLKPQASRLYKTGDLARWRPDGTLDYLGRIDHQVKLRGFRIELGEIEAALRRHPDVRDAVVVAREDTAGDKRIVAYAVMAEEPRTKNREPGNQNQEPRTKNQEPNTEAGGLRLEAGELKTHLRQSLPDYMVPSAFVLLPALPLTPNGKVDRKALPAPDGTQLGLEHSFVAPRTATEEQVAALWREVLRQERVGVHDNFFELGGHSLLATQLIVRLRTMFQIELPIQNLFAAPTVAGVAEIIDASLWTGQNTVPEITIDQGFVEGEI